MSPIEIEGAAIMTWAVTRSDAGTVSVTIQPDLMRDWIPIGVSVEVRIVRYGEQILGRGTFREFFTSGIGRVIAGCISLIPNPDSASPGAPA